ncbi:MAG TPA: hypothetical protein DCM87_03080 [Planctomycetes bacterium]|nr:hypothetical protein [Planctomycetota bacterium]
MREDIVAMEFLHIDLDPRAGEPLQEERQRIVRLLTEGRPPDVPEPTYIIDSGGGFQALWQLREPIAIDGDLARAEDAARYNKRLEMLFGADRCHNIDRLLRLPSTWNIPDERKRKRGRERALAEVYSYRPENVYGLAQFQQTPEESPSDEPRAVGDIDKLSDRLKIIAVQGRDPDNPKEGDDSRSAWLFDFLCNAIRDDLDDATIYRIITGPAYGIAESVLEKRRPHDYALRQIANARREVAKEADTGFDAVAWVNARYFAALEGGKVAFYREADLEAMQRAAFDFELLPMRLTNRKKTYYSTLWKVSDKRRYYRRGFVLDPNAPPSNEVYNLWRGFSIEPAPGSWDCIREHVYEVLADGNEAHADYILRWTAWSIQNPHLPPRVALVFQSDHEGVGKGAWCNALVHLFGPHGLRIQDMMQLTGRFNAHLRHCCLLFADEAVSPGPDGESSLKGYITEPTIPIERKGVDIVSADNHLHIVVSSNNRAIVPAGASARRFAVFRASDRRAGNHDYFAKLFAEINGAGLAAMLHDMLERDLGGWHPEAGRPDTEALSCQKAESQGPVEDTWYQILQEGIVPPFAERIGGLLKVRTQDMRDYVRREMKRPDVSCNKVSDLFKKLGYKQQASPRPRGFLVPTLAEARRDWDERIFPWTWDEGGDWDGPPF